MACINCDDAPIETYVRVGNSNVLIVGCQEHLAELLKIYKAGLKSQDKVNDLPPSDVQSQDKGFSEAQSPANNLEEILNALENARLGIVDKTPDTPVAFAGWDVWEEMHTVALVQAITALINKQVVAELKKALEAEVGYWHDDSEIPTDVYLENRIKELEGGK